MESIERLRSWSSYILEGDIDKQRDIHQLANEIESEIAEKYMALPLDADGVPIHVGDILTDTRYDEPFEVWAITDKPVSKKLSVCPTMYLKHVKPRTVEDVLDDFSKSLGCMNILVDVKNEAIAKYASELRMVNE